MVRLDGRAPVESGIHVGVGAIDHRHEASGRRVLGSVRIDNDTDLRRSLGLDPVSSDGELLLAAYDRWGETCPARIIGDFAFIIWNLREREIYGARDALGVKPFFYGSNAGRGLAFGSSLPSVLGHSEFSTRVDWGALAGLFDGPFEDHEITLYEDVKRLPPCHFLRADDRGVRVSRYWDFDREAELVLPDDRAYEEAYLHHLRVAVERRLPADGAVGAMLSGGIDSSSIACIARDLLLERDEESLPTFSNVFSDAPRSDERQHIDAVLATGGFDSHVNEGGRRRPLADVDHLLEIHGAPISAANVMLVAQLAELARDAGVTVLLDGFGGDSTTSHGWLRLRELAMGGRLVRLGRELHAFGPALGRPSRSVFVEQTLRWTVKPRLPGWAGSVARRPRFAGEKHRSFLNSRFDSATKRLRGPSKEDVYGTMLSAREQHYFEVTTAAMPVATEVSHPLADNIGIEFRYPFLDRSLVEFCLSLPADQKLRDGWTRSIARRSLDGLLPESVRWRRDKANLSHNFDRLIRTQDRPAVEAVLAEPGPLEALLEMQELRSALQRLDDGTNTPDDAHVLWMATVTHRWLEYAVSNADSPPSVARPGE